ncbi:MAG: hypothetical protein ONB46_21610 [candidate division KSB1 bacterium]|nr:hypothetical protein [candidate division KSB1 bacterium]MDZ7368347.1 hypothetical protein [candidate division KSB1 bacterium]MDZ7403067.1 hypothetical protein [candidate division KSB1 bacterium]
MQAYLDAIRDRVCPVCLDAVMVGNKFVRCGLPAGRKCPVEIYLPQIVDVVESVDSWLMEDYVNVLREKVCASCENSEGEVCVLRLQADCPLDRYFMLVAESIKEVDAQINAVSETAGIP